METEPTQLENQLITKPAVPGATPFGVVTPRRPAFGTLGGSVDLVANYFALTKKNDKWDDIHCYKLKFNFLRGTRQNNDIVIDAPEPTGEKLKAIVRLVLARLVQEGARGCVSDFRSCILSPQLLGPASVTAHPFPHTHLGRQEVWNVGLVPDAGTPVRIQPLHDYLHGRPVEGTSTDLQEAIKYLGIIFGHTSRNDPNNTNIGGSRFFATQGQARVTWRPNNANPNSVEATSAVEVIRGYFQSVRPATGRLLLNANVAYGVFRRTGTMYDRLRDARLSLPVPVTEQAADRWMHFHKIINGTRVVYRPAGPNGVQRIEKVCGLATKQDIPNDTKPPRTNLPRYISPQHNYFAGGGNDVQICTNNGQYETIRAYQQKTHGQQMVNLNLPLINVGKPGNPSYVFAEHCHILPNQSTKNKLSPGEQASMINFAVRLAAPNRRSVQTMARQLLSLDKNPTLASESKPSSPCRDAFGIAVKGDLINVRGRLLKPPTRVYRSMMRGAAEQLEMKAGGWNLMKRQIVRTSGKPAQWGWVTFSSEKDFPFHADAGNALRGMVTTMINHGINISQKPDGAGMHLRDDNTAEAPFKTWAKQRTAVPFIIFVVLPNDHALRYNRIKRWCDVDLGVHSVCITREKLTHPRTRTDPGFHANIGLKVNLKIGGVNHRLTSKNKIGNLDFANTMIVGYDVIHPTNLPPPDKDDKGKKDEDSRDEGTTTTGGQSASEEPSSSKTVQLPMHLKGKDKEKEVAKEEPKETPKKPKQKPEDLPPSIVGLVASIDKDLGQWPAVAWENPPGQELLNNEFVKKFQTRLDLWKTNNGKSLPKNIIIFRDGVSESQFSQVIEHELRYIRAACCSEGYYGQNSKGPNITLIVSVKRHQTRFYPKDINDKGPNAGTVVDRGVTHFAQWDFFLQAHTAIQGTARPAHYTVLVDEVIGPLHKQAGGPQPADVLERLTHDLCYIFGRATRSVSLCPPAYYADLVCTRAKAHKSELFDTMFGMTPARIHGIRQRVVHPGLANSMYYI